MTLESGDIVQIVPTHKWGGCLAVVDEEGDRGWGIQAYVTIPTNDGSPAGPAYIRLSKGDYEPVGAKAIFEPGS